MTLRCVWMAALVALSGCAERSPSDTRNAPAATDSKTAPGPASAPWSDSILVALGNEPFWNVRVTAVEILYRDPEHQEGYRFPPVAAVREGDALVYRTRREALAGEPGPRALELSVKPGTCSDGMSDRQYSMISSLRIGDEMRTGCALYEGAIQSPGAKRP